MNGKELVEQGLRRGIALWRIEDELDWQENQDSQWAEGDVCKQREPVVRRSAHDAGPDRGNRRGFQRREPTTTVDTKTTTTPATPDDGGTTTEQTTK